MIDNMTGLLENNKVLPFRAVVVSPTHPEYITWCIPHTPVEMPLIMWDLPQSQPGKMGELGEEEAAADILQHPLSVILNGQTYHSVRIGNHCLSVV